MHSREHQPTEAVLELMTSNQPTEAVLELMTSLGLRAQGSGSRDHCWKLSPIAENMNSMRRSYATYMNWGLEMLVDDL